MNCADCGSPLTTRRRYCDSCAFRRFQRRRGSKATWAEFEAERAADRARGSAARRGYGAAHRATRAQWAAQVEAGTVACARCGHLIVPGSEWHLDHADDGDGYLGPSHASCNIAARNGHRPEVRVWQPPIKPSPPAPVDDDGRVIRIPHPDGHGFTTPSHIRRWSRDW